MDQEDDSQDEECVISVDGQGSGQHWSNAVGTSLGRHTHFPPRNLERHGGQYRCLWNPPFHPVPGGTQARES